MDRRMLSWHIRTSGDHKCPAPDAARARESYTGSAAPLNSARPSHTELPFGGALLNHLSGAAPPPHCTCFILVFPTVLPCRCILTSLATQQGQTGASSAKGASRILHGGGSPCTERRRSTSSVLYRLASNTLCSAPCPRSAGRISSTRPSVAQFPAVCPLRDLAVAGSRHQ